MALSIPVSEIPFVFTWQYFMRALRKGKIDYRSCCIDMLERIAVIEVVVHATVDQAMEYRKEVSVTFYEKIAYLGEAVSQPVTKQSL